MMCVVVNHDRALLGHTRALEAAGRTGERMQTGGNRLTRDAQEAGNRAASERVHHVVTAGYGQLYAAIQILARHDIEAVIAVLHADILRPNVRALVMTEGQHRAIRAFHNAHRVLIVMVDNDQTADGYEFTELMEGMHDIVNVLEEVEVVGFYVQHDRDGRREGQEGIAVFASLGNEGAVAADAERAADRGQVGTDHNGGIHCRLHGDHGHHRRGSGLAVGTGQTDDIIIFDHHLTPCLCTLDDRDAQFTRTDNLRVIVMHRCGADDEGCALNIFGQMGIGDARAQHFQAIGHTSLSAVRTADRNTLAH